MASKLSVGIVGLPNVGKSTLFNTITRLNALAANYPFATIEPNIGVVPIKDPRLKILSELSNSAETIPTAIEFWDIAGLVKGASEGEGLGNQFLSHIREVDMIIHLVRLFEDPNIIHVENRIHPAEDIKIINQELILKDIETLSKRISDTKAKLKSNKDSKLSEYLDYLEKLYQHLNNGDLANIFTKAHNEFDISDLHLLTNKPILYVANVDEKDLTLTEQELRNKLDLAADDHVVAISVKLESEIVSLSEDEQYDYLKTFGISESGIDKIARLCYQMLGLITFFTTGEKETRAWTIKKGTKAPQAAGVIHTDFEKNFICLECISYDDFVSSGSWNKAREQGKVRQEGKDYEVKDGDIIIVKHNAR